MEHFHALVHHLYVVLGEMSVHSGLWPLLIILFIFLLLSFKSLLDIWGNSPLADVSAQGAGVEARPEAQEQGTARPQGLESRAGTSCETRAVSTEARAQVESSSRPRWAQNKGKGGHLIAALSWNSWTPASRQAAQGSLGRPDKLRASLASCRGRQSRKQLTAGQLVGRKAG